MTNLMINPSFSQSVYTTTHSFTFLSNGQWITPSIHPSIHRVNHGKPWSRLSSQFKAVK